MVAIGDCAVDAGIFAGSYAVVGGVSAVIPVDLHIGRCPTNPLALLKGPARTRRAQRGVTPARMISDLACDDNTSAAARVLTG